MKRPHRTASLAVLMLLCGCTVGPDYKLPPSAVVNKPDAQGGFHTADAALSGQLPPGRWWKLYDDPRLDRMVEAALSANTDLRQAEADLERSAALVKEVEALRQPSVPIEGGVEYAQQAGEQYLLPITPPVSTDYTAGVTVGYDLDLFGGIRRGIEAAKADHQAVEAARDLVKVNVAAETTRAYVDVCSTGLQLLTAQHSLELQKRNLALVERLRQDGRAIDLDVTRSRQLVDQLAGGVPALEAAQRNALYRLAVLTGNLPGDFDASLQSCQAPPQLLSPLPVGDGASLLQRRPDVRAAERQLAAATAEIGVATSGLYPDVQLGVSAGSIGRTADFLKSPTNFWDFGGLIQWQANQSAARAKIAAANAGAKLALAHFDGVVLGALRDVESALNVYVHDLEREKSALASRADAARAADDAHRLERDGRASELAVLDAERNLAAADQSLAQIQSVVAADQVAVFLALGGGWQPDDTKTAEAGP